MKNSLTSESRTRISILAFSILTMALFGWACDTRDDSSTNPSRDFEAPPVPTGVTTTTMDRAVLVSWEPIYLDPDYDDLAGFRVYRSTDNYQFSHIATTDPDETEYTDDGLVNGETYFYAVSSFDFDGNESDLSYDDAYDTPRPEGFDQRIYTFTDINYETQSGFDFASRTRLPWDSPACDFYLEYDPDPNTRSYFLWLGDDGIYFQDMGYTDSFDDITYAPLDGWSRFAYIEAIIGHTYVMLIDGEHYAKVRVTGFVDNPTFGIIFDWGYQVDPGNRELKIGSQSVKIDGNSPSVEGR